MCSPRSRAIPCICLGSFTRWVNFCPYALPQLPLCKLDTSTHCPSVVGAALCWVRWEEAAPTSGGHLAEPSALVRDLSCLHAQLKGHPSLLISTESEFTPPASHEFLAPSSASALSPPSCFMSCRPLSFGANRLKAPEGSVHAGELTTGSTATSPVARISAPSMLVKRVSSF